MRFTTSSDNLRGGGLREFILPRMSERWAAGSSNIASLSGDPRRAGSGRGAWRRWNQMFPITWSLVLSPRLDRYDFPPFLGLTGSHDLSVMLENHPRRIAHLQRDLSGTFAFCQAVAGEAVA